MPKNATLRGIDELLRETWLECCGHRSLFDSGATRFVSDGFDTSLFDYENPSLDHRAGWTIPPGTESEYQYDIEDATCISIRVDPAPEQARVCLATHESDPAEAGVSRYL